MKTIINIDASSLSAASCIRHWYWTVVSGYREKVSGASLIYGTAVHKYIDTMYKTDEDIVKSRDAALEAFRKPKTIGKGQDHLADERHLITVCYNTWEEWIKKDGTFDTLMLPNGVPATELTFDFPYYEDDNVIIRLKGTIDRVGKIRNGVFCIKDFKTTSKFKWQEYLAAYKMSKQLRFYALAMKIMSEREPDSLLGKIGKTNMGCQIDGIFLKAKPSEVEYHSSDVFIFGDETIAEFRSMLDDFVWYVAKVCATQSLSLPRQGIFNGTCKTEYACKFIPVCGAPTQMQPVLLERDYRVVPYDPLKFGEVA